MNAGLPGVASAGYHQSTSRTDHDRSTIITWRPLQEALAGHSWDRPVCLMIDEAQNLDKPGTELLASMHLGSHELPFFPLLMGLADTDTKIRKKGSTWLDNNAVHTLSALQKEEVAELCDKYFTTFRIRGSNGIKSDCKDLLFNWSEGWPSHMHNALLGLTTELIKTNGDLTTANLTKSLTHAQGYRNMYYKSRVGDIFDKSPGFLGEFMTGLNEEKKVSAGDIDGLIEYAQKRAVVDLGDRRIGDHSVQEVFHHLLHQGFIQSDDIGDYVCPIPSLRSWCLTKADLEDPLEGTSSQPPAK